MDSNPNVDYYSNQYFQINRTGLQGWGNSISDKLIEKLISKTNQMNILEIGASSGEHYEFVKSKELILNYYALDINPKVTNPRLAEHLEINNYVKFIKGDAENIPFEDNFFDATISTCVLAHVNDPEKVFQELRRVTKPSGQIIIAMPTDPGFLNRLIKVLFTYKVLHNSGVEDPRLLYAREHRNSIDKLLAFSKHVYQKDKLRIRYYPFGVKSWNLNLLIVLDVSKFSG